MQGETLYLASDYQEGAHPLVMESISRAASGKHSGYGTDEICASAREKIRAACAAPEAAVHFLVGGTQTNATVISALLKSYQGVIAAASGHISVHEAGAIEMGGHKVLALPHALGKISAASVREYCETFWSDGNHEHMVAPGMVYISQPTEYGTLYSLAELAGIKDVCSSYGLPLYVDGARLAYGLACGTNDVSLPALARLADVFYIGGTKCGAFLGEAAVIPRPSLLPHFFTIVKQHGALLAKGWLLGAQFDALFTQGLYFSIGKPAIQAADKMRRMFREAGYELAFDSPTNQVFVILRKDASDRLQEQAAGSFWEKYDEERNVYRFASSWATTEEDMERLRDILHSSPL